MLNVNSLERIVPDYLVNGDVTGKKTLDLHYERYRFAKTFSKGKILDIACGVGYGSYFLANETIGLVDVTGVDIDEDAVNYAQKTYQHNSLVFYAANAKKFDIGQKYDTIVSLETIEHVTKPRELIEHFFNLMNQDGYLIVSVPITPSVDINPHHVNDFTEKSFESMFNLCGFKKVEKYYQTQSYNPFGILSGKEKRTSQIRQNLVVYYLMNPIAICKRVKSLLIDGFNNKYITIVFKKSVA